MILVLIHPYRYKNGESFMHAFLGNSHQGAMTYERKKNVDMKKIVY